MIEMNMCQQDIGDLLRLKSGFAYSFKQGLYGAAWSGIDEYDLVFAGEQVGTYNLFLTLER
jgi:hypothetical protein